MHKYRYTLKQIEPYTATVITFTAQDRFEYEEVLIDDLMNMFHINNNCKVFYLVVEDVFLLRSKKIITYIR